MDKLYEFTFPVVLLRLALAMFCGGIIGYGRSRRRKAAGFRTYMLVAIGGCMTVLMSLYYHEMMHGNEIWVAAIAEVGEKFDGVRFAAQAVTGIGFLASGTILRNPHQKVEGLTTAAGLLTTVCMGIAAGAGYYSLVICIFILLMFILTFLFPVEIAFKRRTRNLVIYVEVNRAQDIGRISDTILQRGASILDMELEGTTADDNKFAAVYHVKLSRERASHSEMLSAIARQDCVYAAEEIIS